MKVYITGRAVLVDPTPAIVAEQFAGACHDAAASIRTGGEACVSLVGVPDDGNPWSHSQRETIARENESLDDFARRVVDRMWPEGVGSVHEASVVITHLGTGYAIVPVRPVDAATVEASSEKPKRSR